MRLRFLLRQLATLSVVGGLLAWFAVSAGTDVTIEADGRRIAANTYAGTVADALDDAGVVVGAQDRVEPSLDQPIVDGDAIRVTRAVPVVLRIEGVGADRMRVPARTVAEVVHAAGLEPIRALAVTPSLETAISPGAVISVRLPITVTIVADGQEREVTGDASTVGGFLDLAGLDVGPDDEIAPPPGTTPHDGLRIEVRRVDLSEVVEEVVLPFSEERHETDTLERGQTRVVQEGEEGLRLDTWRVRAVDGVEVSREKVSEEVVREPRSRIVEVGTRDPQPCCAGAGHAQSGAASWYDSPHGSYTAAHRTLPIGTVVTVTNTANGASVRVRIADRGPFVEGRVIDLDRVAFSELASLSTGVIRVEVTW